MKMDWNSELNNSICTVSQLRKYTDLSHDVEMKLNEIIKRHPMCVTPYYMSLIDWDNPSDPIKKIAIPSLAEFNLEGSYDTSGELENTKLSGLQHKYDQTALILSTNKCATYCRYCFRKRLVGRPSNEVIKRFDEAVEYIKKHDEIDNVLISGGDPLVLSNEIIESFLAVLSDISHLKFIRFGSRTPVMLPSRFEDDELLDIFRRYSQSDRRIYVVTQFNYPREITREAVKAINNLISAGIILTNQTVLLKGINDYPKTLAKLQNELVSIGVNPYYVFQCRPVRRVKSSFQIPLYKGIDIVETAKKSCNGHSKRFKYIMSHRKGKIEILGIYKDEIYFKYHQAKDIKNLGRIFKRKMDKNAGWLDDLKRH
jgi:KamA family protein